MSPAPDSARSAGIDDDGAAGAAGPTPQQEPLLRFTAGNPTPEEIAAVSAVLLSATSETESAGTSPGARRAQNRRARLGMRLRPGLGAWRRTLPFR